MSEQQVTTGEKWGDLIARERQEELQSYIRRWVTETDHGERMGPFAGVRLTGADVFWLAQEGGMKKENLHLEGANLREANLQEADLTWYAWREPIFRILTLNEPS